jgi:hypothetical protein
VADDHFDSYAILRTLVLGPHYATRKGPDGSPIQANIVNERDNPLLDKGLLLVCLGAEAYLADDGQGSNQQAVTLLSQTLDSLERVFRQSGPFSGYPVRADVVGSVCWESSPVGGGTRSQNYFLNDDGSYCYATPLHDHRSPALVSAGVFDSWDPAARGRYAVQWSTFVDRYRYWEPSSDELLGLLAGYSVAYDLVRDAGSVTASETRYRTSPHGCPQTAISCCARDRPKVSKQCRPVS